MRLSPIHSKLYTSIGVTTPITMRTQKCNDDVDGKT
jgi:hypothetical protein